MKYTSESTRTIRVVTKRPNEAPQIELIDGTPASLQRVVDGYIERLRVEDFDVFCNEEGKRLDLPPNILLSPDVIFGTVIVSKSERGHQVSLTEAEAAHAMQLLAYLEVAESTTQTWREARCGRAN